MPFLTIPRELRNLVYAHAVVPTVPLADYKALLLSCRQIREEYHQECELALKGYCRSLEEGTHGIRVSVPEALSLKARCNLRISLSTKLFTDYPTPRESLFLPSARSYNRQISRAYFASVTIAFHEDDGVPFGVDNIRWVHQNIIYGLHVHGDTIKTYRVIIEKPTNLDFKCDRLFQILGHAEMRQSTLAPNWKAPLWREIESQMGKITLERRTGEYQRKDFGTIRV